MNANEPQLTFRAGFVALIGRPNVGKSTLVNMLLGQPLAAVSPRPQTTRRQQLGILTLAGAQLVFVDTPGMHQAQHALGEYMNQAAQAALEDADVVVWLVDASESPQAEDRLIAARLAALPQGQSVLLALNKVDQVQPDRLETFQAQFQALAPGAVPLRICALSGAGKEAFIQALVERVPEGAPFYEDDQITDLYEREIAVDMIRAAALIHLRDEIPHAIAVRIDEYSERSEEQAYIAATLFVEREAHKGMVVGQGGEMIKKIGSTARRSIEEMSGRKVFLELRVKVSKNWRDDPSALRQFGYIRREDKA